MSIHGNRHNSYRQARSLAEAAHGMTDTAIMKRLDIHDPSSKPAGYFRDRSIARVKRRIYIQEALKRGLISEDPKDARY